MALTTSPPCPARVVGRGARGLTGRLLAAVLTALAFATLLCGTAMAVQMPAGVAQAHPAQQASSAAHAVLRADMADQADCEECVREGGRAHCGSLPEGVRDTPAHSGPCAAPPPGQAPVAAAPVQAAAAVVPGGPASRPPDLHQLQVLRV